MNKLTIHNKDIACEELEQANKGEGITMFGNERKNPLNSNETLCESVNGLSNEGKPIYEDSTRNIYYVDQQKFQLILTELSCVFQMLGLLWS